MDLGRSIPQGLLQHHVRELDDGGVLEEVWYADDPPVEWLGDVEVEAGPSYVRETLTSLFGGVAPYLAPVHAALGGFVLTRELFKYFGAGREAALALVSVHALLAALVVVRRRGALLFAFTVVALSAPYLATSSGDPLATALLLNGLLVVGLVLSRIAGTRLPEVTADEAGAHAQAVVIVVLLSAFLYLEPLELGLPAYLPALSLPFFVLLFQERHALADSSLSTLVCLVAGLAVVRMTVEAFGIVPIGPVWVAGWSVAIILVSARLRTSQLFLAGYGLLVVGDAVFLTPDSGALQDVVGTLWIGAVVSVVPLLLALGMDRSIHGRTEADQPVHRAAGPMTYFMYGLGFLLLSALADEQLPMGWSLVAPALLGLGLILQADRLRAERAVSAVVVVLVAVHAFVFSVTRGAGIEALLLPLLVLAATTLGAERVVAARQADDDTRTVRRVARMVLVVMATATTMAAIYESTQLGTQWATAGWSVLGVVLMGVGFGLRSGMHRRLALVVLAMCLLRVFMVDTQGLSDTARTVAFFVLGLCLVGVAWLYSRFSEELKSWL